MNPEAWIKLLYTYGPFAILVFLVFVTERKTRTALKEAGRDEKSRMMFVYLLNWAVIFGLVLFSMYAWTRINLEEEPTIRGRVNNITGREILSVESDNPSTFLVGRVPVANRVQYQWRLLGRFYDGEKVKLVFDPNEGQGDAAITDNQLIIKSQFFKKDNVVRISYNKEKDKMYLEENGREIELEQSKSLIGKKSPETLWNLFSTTVFAQGFRKEEFEDRLQSLDPIIRRNARGDLARQGGNALPWIEDVLGNPKSSYRLQLGVIVALNNMSGVNIQALRPSTITAIQHCATNSDEALRTESLKFLNRYQVSFPVTVYEHVKLGGRSQGFGEGRFRADYGQLGALPNDTASSVRVIKGYRVRLCENEGDGKAAGRCEEYGEGTFNLRTAKAGGVADRVSQIEVIRK